MLISTKNTSRNIITSIIGMISIRALRRGSFCQINIQKHSWKNRLDKFQAKKGLAPLVAQKNFS
jgi:hypothetical protein